MSRATNSLPSADNRPSDVEIDRRRTTYFGWTMAQLDEAAPKGIQAVKPVEVKTVAAKPLPVKPIEVTLANATVTVRFTAYAESKTVTITTTTKDGRKTLTTTTEHARSEYARLLRCGFWKW